MKFCKSKFEIPAWLMIGFVLSVVFVLRPTFVFAATVRLTPAFETVSVGDTVIVNVEMDTVNKTPNVVEGSIAVSSGAEKIEIPSLSVSGSALDIWSQVPLLNQDTSIVFTGGKPGGFNQKSAVLFKIILVAKEAGQVVFSPVGIKAYDNDGKGTAIDVSSELLTINIETKKTAEKKDQWQEIVTNDKRPPEGLTAVFGQDHTIFEGKKFINISAVDDQSGIDYYEVKEGDRQMVRSGENYVLLDQNESSTILIAVHDKAGNSSQISLSPKKQKFSYVRMIFGIAVFGALIYGLFRLLKLKMKKNVSTKE